jgi:hypothetical protein
LQAAHDGFRPKLMRTNDVQNLSDVSTQKCIARIHNHMCNVVNARASRRIQVDTFAVLLFATVYRQLGHWDELVVVAIVNRVRGGCALIAIHMVNDWTALAPFIFQPGLGSDRSLVSPTCSLCPHHPQRMPLRLPPSAI